MIEKYVIFTVYNINHQIILYLKYRKKFRSKDCRSKDHLEMYLDENIKRYIHEF